MVMKKFLRDFDIAVNNVLGYNPPRNVSRFDYDQLNGVLRCLNMLTGSTKEL